jgi:hypothetical protein
MRSDVDDLLRPAFGMVLRHRMIEHCTVMLVAPHDSHFIDERGVAHQQWRAVVLGGPFPDRLAVVGHSGSINGVWEVVG